jgi:hypothetical protein
LYSLEGSQAFIEVVWAVADGKPGETKKVYANIASVQPPKHGAAPITIPKNWTAPPIKSYAEWGQAVTAALLPIATDEPVNDADYAEAVLEVSDDDIPF